MELNFKLKNTENVRNLSEAEIKKIAEIFEALIATGSLTGVKGGKTILHFDDLGTFRGIELDYWPFRRRNPG